MPRAVARDRALGVLVAAEGRPVSDRASVALVPYDDGCLAMSVDGVVDHPAGEHLMRLLPELRWLGRHEMHLQLADLTASSPPMMRFLGHLRLHQALTDGALELHHPPPDLVRGLDDVDPEHVSIHHPRPAVHLVRGGPTSW